jgi:putative SOS response-associated peptidase YedK
MCGRFTRHYTWREIQALYQLTLPSAPSNLPPRYNICPTTDIDVVVPDEEGRKLASARWGLVPGWWKKPAKELPATFNARAETVAEKPMFRDAFRKGRCLIPASGYYEWIDTPDGKQPFYFTRADGQVLTIAGVCADWKNPQDGKSIKSAAMVIGAANDFVGNFHDRMPVILEEGEFGAWERGDAKLAEDLLRGPKENVLQAWPVSRRVNSSKTDEFDPTLIERVAA